MRIVISDRHWRWLRRGRACLLSALLAACSGTTGLLPTTLWRSITGTAPVATADARLEAEGDDGDDATKGARRGVPIEELEFRGQAALTEDELRPLAAFGETPGSVPSRIARNLPLTGGLVGEVARYDAVALDDAVDRMTNLYRRRGYFSAVIEPEVTFREDRSAVRILFDIREGAPVEIARVELTLAEGTSAPSIDVPKLRAEAGLEPGQIFEIARYDVAKQRILESMREAGYLEAHLEGGAEVDVPNRSAQVQWQLIPGPLALLGSIRFEGLDRIERQSLEREFQANAGAPISSSWLEQTQRQLAELGWFRSVTVRTLPDEAESRSALQDDGAEYAERWPVLIRVEERPPRSIRASIGYGTEDRTRAEFGWQHRHLLGNGRGVSVRARRSSLLTALELDFLFPRVAGTQTLAELSLDGKLETLGAYDARRAQASLEFRRTLKTGGRFAFGHRVDLTRIDDVSPAAESILDDPEESSIESALFAKLDVGRLDDRASPSRGQTARFSAEFASQAFGSEDDFVRSEVDLRVFRPLRTLGLSAPGVLAGRLHLGTSIPLGSTNADDLPLTERFFAGGGDSVRGFEFQQLGPLDATNEPLGGTSLLVANVEWRVPLSERFGSVLFVDAGQVDLEPLRFRPSNLLYSAGAGMRLQTPVGPIRLDLASLLNRPSDLDRFRIHFSIGHTF